MKEGTVQILPLYYFFERLRQNEFPLGIDDYENFIEVAQFELGISATSYGPYLEVLRRDSPLNKNNTLYPKNQLFRLCKILWLKPNQSTRLFEDLFEETFFLDFQPIQDITESAESPIKKSTNRSDEEKIPGSPELPEKVDPDTSNLTGEMATDTKQKEALDKSVFVRIGMSEKQKSGYLELTSTIVETDKTKFLFSDRYYPIDRRKIQQNLRALPTGGYQFNTKEIDVDATIQKAIEVGFFKDVVTKKQKSPAANMLFLVDHQGSMVAFQQMAGNIQSELEHVFLLNKKMRGESLKTFYFFNTINEFVFLNTTHTKYQLVTSVLAPLKTKTSYIIILSDAGAARGNINSDRINSTKKMLQQLRNYTHKIAWLNPMPKERWAHSSAEVIAENIAMFEANENGIKNAVDFLKGSSTKTIQMV